MVELAQQKLGMPARLGIPDKLSSPKGEKLGAAHSTAAGLLVCARESLEQPFFGGDTKKSDGVKRSGFEKFRDWLLGDSGK